MLIKEQFIQEAIAEDETLSLEEAEEAYDFYQVLSEEAEEDEEV